MLHVQPHALFQREGDDLLCEVPVSFVQAARWGRSVRFPLLNGPSTIKTAGVQPGTMFRLKGKGVKNVQGYGHDLHVRIAVEVPTRLSGRPAAKRRNSPTLQRKETRSAAGSLNFRPAHVPMKSEGRGRRIARDPLAVAARAFHGNVVVLPCIASICRRNSAALPNCA